MIARLTSLALASIVCSAPAIAQDAERAPRWGGIYLSAGFTPDPYEFDLEAGGPVHSGRAIRSSCPGNITDEASVEIYYNAGSFPLIFSAYSGIDATLVILGPDNAWHCDDDSGQGTNPRIEFTRPNSGSYLVWVGSYAADTTAPAVLKVSEIAR
ncbi:peptidase S1 [Maricaulis sp.]|uniref:peptidase S1 n=1 Tax=Maricaulis sp. TaxID=1486257 RepID=UPI001B200C57|nr:peptidase S1 [Maricaulis sp.]MBO6796095.1 peptidase S1 [Maricaulis sp.]